MKGYTTTEKNKKQLIDKYPPEDFRNFSEDLIPEERSSENNLAAPEINLDE